jgi:hypothetical protein
VMAHLPRSSPELSKTGEFSNRLTPFWV